MWTPDKSSQPEIPAPDPKRPWELNHNDRRFLRSLNIGIENAPWPEEGPRGEEDED